MFFFWGSGSPPCWKAMLVLAEKGLWDECPKKMLKFSEKEHKGSDVMAINPRGQLPTFKDGDVTVNESGAICMYLEEKFNDRNKLFPSDVGKRAEVYQRMFEVQNIVSNIMETLVRPRMQNKGAPLDEEKTKENVAKAKEELDRWNKMLVGKEFLCGNEFTMGDVFFIPFLAILKRLGATLSGHPELNRYYDSICGRPSVQATWPPHWKEGPGPDLLNKDL